VARAVAPLGWHIEMYVPWQLLPTLLPVIRSLPVPMVFDHMAGLPADTDRNDPVLLEVLDLLAADRAWVKLTGYRNSRAGPPYADVAWLARRFVAAAPGRCVWGSDWPHTVCPDYMPDDGDLLDLLSDWVPDKETLERVLVTNPATLYRF
jgi:predicted TIM-barrel fold metal-dependent hydrolase